MIRVKTLPGSKEIMILNEAEMIKYNIDEDNCLRVTSGLYGKSWAHIEHWNRVDLLWATGHGPAYENGKIDPAVPQGWLDRQGPGTRAYWSYEVNGTFGEPLYYSTLLAELKEMILIAMSVKQSLGLLAEEDL